MSDLKNHPGRWIEKIPNPEERDPTKVYSGNLSDVQDLIRLQDKHIEELEKCKAIVEIQDRIKENYDKMRKMPGVLAPLDDPDLLAAAKDDQ